MVHRIGCNADAHPQPSPTLAQRQHRQIQLKEATLLQSVRAHLCAWRANRVTHAKTRRRSVNSDAARNSMWHHIPTTKANRPLLIETLDSTDQSAPSNVSSSKQQTASHIATCARQSCAGGHRLHKARGRRRRPMASLLTSQFSRRHLS